jgi:hypothetical protein
LIPITNAVTYLNSSTGWEANNKPALFKIRVTFSYTGGDGSWVFYFASAESNVGYYSEFSGFSTAHQISSYGDWVYADYTNSPYVVNFSGSAIYDDP